MQSETTTAITAVNQDVRLREWAEQLEAQQASGLTVPQWCAENGIKTKSFYYRLRRVREQYIQSAQAVVPLTVPQQQSADIRIEKNDLHISLPTSITQELAQENAALRSRVAVLEEELALIQEQFAWLKKQVFGRKTEQSSVIMDNGQQLTLFPEGQGQSAKTAEETITVPEHKRKKKRTHDDWMSKLPVEEIEHKEEHPICENCGAEMKEIGKEKAYDELVFTPAKYHIRRHIVYTYKCTECGVNPEYDNDCADEIEHCNIRRAYYPKPMIPGSFCSPELLAHIVYEKYAKAVPLHRQEKDLASKHIPLLKATMSNWILTAAEKWCLPVLEKMHELLLTSSVIHADLF